MFAPRIALAEIVRVPAVDGDWDLDEVVAVLAFAELRAFSDVNDVASLELLDDVRELLCGFFLGALFPFATIDGDVPVARQGIGGHACGDEKNCEKSNG
ncbi:MAG: hypothetical protein GY822_25475 [Deltaproteobacteria bacterium]|nr:hypothetical protein [Deltaproteobacteria bacterium]